MLSTAVDKDKAFPSIKRLYYNFFTVPLVFSYSSPGVGNCFQSKQYFLLWILLAFTTEPNTGNLAIAYPKWYYSDEAWSTSDWATKTIICNRKQVILWASLKTTYRPPSPSWKALNIINIRTPRNWRNRSNLRAPALSSNKSIQTKTEIGGSKVPNTLLATN